MKICEQLKDCGGEKCPNRNCRNKGWYYIGIYGEVEQCEWCYLNPNSIYNTLTTSPSLSG